MSWRASRPNHPLPHILKRIPARLRKLIFLQPRFLRRLDACPPISAGHRFGNTRFQSGIVGKDVLRGSYRSIKEDSTAWRDLLKDIEICQIFRQNDSTKGRCLEEYESVV